VGLDMDGRVVGEAFVEPPAPQTVPSWDDEPGDAGLHPPEMRQDPFEAADALRQLIDLGYMADTGDDQQALVDLTRRESNFNLAVVCMTTGKPAKAVPLFRALAEEKPDDARYRSLLAQAEHAAGEHAAALASIERWMLLAPGAPEPALLRVAVLAGLGRADEAGAALASLESVHARDGALARSLAELCAVAGNWERSAEHAARAIAHDGAAPEPHVTAARAALELGRFEACVEHCLDATERLMALPEAHYLLGAALAWAGELEHAAQSLDYALKFAPGHAETLRFAAAVARARGDAARADELATQAAAAVDRPVPWTSARGAAVWAAQRG